MQQYVELEQYVELAEQVAWNALEEAARDTLTMLAGSIGYTATAALLFDTWHRDEPETAPAAGAALMLRQADYLERRATRTANPRRERMRRNIAKEDTPHDHGLRSPPDA